jgi:UDP-N-acetylglucosamine diphosphorylase / glucose-1-phosphate thymidylyltransferase / UDP-N-acetylgalactosamine diphosphorylase / glucosamine-1-phosphate N-acetyltransferase / galactosamine-1-phosphate N-acetyltransferase
MFSASEYLDLRECAHSVLFDDAAYAWDPLKKIGSYLKTHLTPGFFGSRLGTSFVGDAVFIGKGTVVEPGATIKGPAWIGERCEIRSSCYIRENVIVGDGVVLGNSCEFKNCLIFNDAEIPHFSYVGDSILGHRAHLGAGVILSNFRLDRKEISVRHEGTVIETGLRKFGAIIGDRVEIGCNTAIRPGSLIGRDCLIYPLTDFGGVLAEKTILKSRQNLQKIPREHLPESGSSH